MRAMWRREEGFALVTGIMVSLVVLLLGIAVVQIAVHNTGSSAFDRDRVTAVDAAEAGIDAYASALTTTPDPCVVTNSTMDSNPPAAYQVSVQLYAAWPPTAGSELTCPLGEGVLPAGALVTSVGSIQSAAAAGATRTMEAAIQLTPIYSGLGQAIFSDTGLGFNNQFQINGYQANDGDVYTNGDFTVNNNVLIAGSAYVQGSANISQGVVKGDVWANGSTSLSGGIQVYGDAISSTAYDALSNNSHVYGDAKAATTVTGGTVDGARITNSPSGPPPQKSLPEVPWDPSAWMDTGYVIQSFTDCASASSFIKNPPPSGKYVVRISPACPLVFGNNTKINLNDDMAIITDGSFTTQNLNQWNGVGGTHILYIIRPYESPLDCSSGAYDISTSNKTSFNSLQLFVYTPCTINFSNNNANGVDGQLIGGTVNINNQMVLNYVPIQVPKFNLTGYSAAFSYKREIPS